MDSLLYIKHNCSQNGFISFDLRKSYICPYCQYLIGDWSISLKNKLPSPFSKSIPRNVVLKYPGCIDSLYLSFLHIGITNSEGSVYHFTVKGLQFDVNGWEECINFDIKEIINSTNLLKKKLNINLFDNVLNRMLENSFNEPSWNTNRYNEAGNNCLDFILKMINLVISQVSIEIELHLHQIMASKDNEQLKVSEDNELLSTTKSNRQIIMSKDNKQLTEPKGSKQLMPEDNEMLSTSKDNRQLTASKDNKQSTASVDNGHSLTDQVKCQTSTKQNSLFERKLDLMKIMPTGVDENFDLMNSSDLQISEQKKLSNESEINFPTGLHSLSCLDANLTTVHLQSSPDLMTSTSSPDANLLTKDELTKILLPFHKKAEKYRAIYDCVKYYGYCCVQLV